MVSSLVSLAMTGTFWQAVGDTMVKWAIGLAIAFVAGVGLGMLLGTMPAVRKAFNSTIEFLRPIPSVALIPLIILLYGTGATGTVILIVYACFWQVLVQTIYGVQDLDPVARDTSSIFRVKPLMRLTRFIWPTALPFVITGLRLAASVALVLAVTGELVIGSPGIGKEIALARSSASVEPMYAYIIAAGLLGLTVNLAFPALERTLLRWHPSVRGEVL
jgi:ABC-type nitrate/sulfonate/bicarbonate transport system permease component